LPKTEITNVQQFTVLVEASMLPKLTKVQIADIYTEVHTNIRQ